MDCNYFPNKVINKMKIYLQNKKRYFLPSGFQYQEAFNESECTKDICIYPCKEKSCTDLCQCLNWFLDHKPSGRPQ